MKSGRLRKTLNRKRVVGSQLTLQQVAARYEQTLMVMDLQKRGLLEEMDRKEAVWRAGQEQRDLDEQEAVLELAAKAEKIQLDEDNHDWNSELYRRWVYDLTDQQLLAIWHRNSDEEYLDFAMSRSGRVPWIGSPFN